jgi:4-carboxymuconolactone decarboxylase
MKRTLPMPRLGELDRAELSESQRRIADEIRAGPRGDLRGPFWPWLRSPELADRAQRLGEFVRYRTSLPKRLVELAVLFTARTWLAQFEWYAHAPIARQAGIADSTIRAIGEGSRPPELTEAEAAVYDFCAELYETRRIGDATYEAARRHLGEQGVVELVGILGYYALVSMTLNAFRVPLPGGETPPFAEPASAGL